MTNAEQREAARRFINTWRGKGYEKGDTQRFWMSLLSDVLDMDYVADKIVFEKEVIIDGQTKYIDAYISETKVLIEQKSLTKDLNKALPQSGGKLLTPYEQAKNYANNLPVDEAPRWIVTCNFEEFHVYDMNKPGSEPESILLENLQTEIYRFSFLLNNKIDNISKEMEISIQAGDLVGDLYEALLKEYKDPTNEDSLKSLNALCVRLVFCLYAEDAGIFGRHSMFHDYLMRFDIRDLRKALIELFQVLDIKPEDRDPYMDEELAAFPYVNGGLFSDANIEIPQLTEEIRELILKKASEDFDWSEISPTIFGAVFESTLNPETRRAGGMHYTSIENIHKVIDPLFLDDLTEELEEIKAITVTKTKKTKLDDFQNKLAELKFLDPACGSGNFLTESYIALRKIENEILKLKMELEKGQVAGQIMMGDLEGVENPIKVSINQFYGIEINDFAVTVAKTALWIAESQMMKATEDVIHLNLDFLPLKSYANIVEGNALKIDWNDVISSNELNYIMGNPPFVGIRHSKENHRSDLKNILSSIKKSGSLDYVTAWYIKSADMMSSNNKLRTAFVSTNSIVQGEQAYVLWNYIIKEQGNSINFAYQTFKWNSEASEKAAVHCVIIGFSKNKNLPCRLFTENGEIITCDNINEYLLPLENMWIKKSSNPISKRLEMLKGCYPTDNGNYIFTLEEKDDFIKKEPLSEKWFRKWIGSNDMLNGKERYILFLKECPLSELKKMPLVLERVKNVREIRLKSTKEATRKKAETPLLLDEERIPLKDFLVIPVVSSENRRYVPIEFHQPPDICYASCFFIEGASLFLFGLLMSNVHNAWMRTVCGRLKSDYRYSNTLVYNNFPWPNLTKEQELKIEQTAQSILDARALYPNWSLADLYHPLFMPVELRKAHQANDRAVMQAYGLNIKETSEADCVAHLMKMYQELTK